MTYSILIMQSYPFNWKNPYGYLIAVISQCIVALNLLHYVSCFVSIALGAYFYAKSLNGFMEDDLQSINEMVKQKKTKTDFIEPFSSFICTHADIKQLS